MKKAENREGQKERGSPIKLKLSEVAQILEGQILTCPEKADLEIGFACSADLMSDVLAFSRPGTLLLTGLTNSQSLQTADIAEVKAVVFVRGKQPDRETLRLSEEKGIPVIATRCLMFESCGRLYVRGLRG